MALSLVPQPNRLHLADTIETQGREPGQLLLDPRQAGTQKYGWIARSGGGKSYGAGKLAELLFGAGVPVIVLDPVGNWYGLRMSADGKSPGIEIPVIGGRRGDLPLDLERAAALAEWLVEHDGSAVIDLSELRKNERKRFVAAFAEALFHAAKSNRRPRMLVIEEAQVFAPQMSKGSEQMLGAIEDLVRLGRNYGIGSMLISQRPQSVNKEVLNQVECLFVGQLQGAHERKAIREWCAGKQVGESGELASLQPGTFYCWSPQWLGWFGKVRILPKETFDASATPDLGDVEFAPAPIRKMELEALRLVMSAPAPTGKGQEAEGPGGLLRLDLPEPSTGSAELVAAADEVMRLTRERDDAKQDLEVVRGHVAHALEALGVLVADAQRLEREVSNIAGYLVSRETLELPPVANPIRQRRQDHEALKAARAEPARRAVAEARVLTVGAVDGDLASMMLAALGSAGRLLSRVELAIRVAVAHSGGYYRRTLRDLLDSGLIASMESGNLMLTEAGKERAQRTLAGPPRGKALVAAWKDRLKGAAPDILQALIDERQGLSSDALATAVGKQASGGYFRRGLRQVRNAGLVVGDAGRWSLSDEAKHLGR